MKKYLFFSFFLSSMLTYGQQGNITFEKKNFNGNDSGYQKAIDSMNVGDELFYNKKETDNYLAIPYYMTAEKFNPNNAELNYKIGACMLTRNSPFKTGALSYLKKAYALDSNVAPDIHYYLGRAYHLNMDWESAKKEYRIYLQSLKNDKKYAKEIADTKKKIEECNNGEMLVEHPIKVSIENLGPNINTKYPEYGVLVNADETEMIFTSKRPNTVGNSMDAGSSQYTEDIYISHFINGAWSPSTNTNTALNTDDNDATAGISLDGKILYIYRGNNGGDLYVTHSVNDTGWSAPALLSDKINSKYFETSVCITPDGKTIYFVSERPGGYGGRDIYKIDIDSSGNYGDAQNLGPVINTQYNEEGVAVHPDGKTLYFSSEGHNTMGGYDVFKSFYNGKTWSVPENIGYPINTPDDDVFFCVSASGKHAYYSSIRKGGEGEKDIYRITFLNDETNLTTSKVKKTKTKNTHNSIKINGLVTDSKGNGIESSIEITNDKTHKVISKSNSNNQTGQYHLTVPAGNNYAITVNADGYHSYSNNIDVPDSSENGEITEKNIVLEPINIQNVPIGTSIALESIYYNFNKASLRQESKHELSWLIDMLTKNPNLKIEISSYTDNVGSVDYNMKLSEARAKSVVNYLVGHNIDVNRLTYKGYGKDNPIASNKTKKGRRLNRRTEFKILSK